MLPLGLVINESGEQFHVLHIGAACAAIGEAEGLPGVEGDGDVVVTDGEGHHSETSFHVRQDIQGIARLFHLALLLDDDSFESFLRNSRPFFNKDDRQYTLEQTVYEWMALHWKLTDDTAVRQSFAQLTEQLRIKEQQHVIGAGEFRIWAQAYAEGVTVREVYGRNFRSLTSLG